MHVTREKLSDTRCKLTITGDQKIIDQIKAATVARMGERTKVPGFRPGKAPAALVEKQLDQAVLQSEFLEQAVNHFYVEAVRHEQLRPVIQPEINISKFVPFTTLEFTAEVETVGAIELADYTKVKVNVDEKKVTADEVDQVIDNLRSRAADKQTVTRAAKRGDEVVLDFDGRDAKTNEPIGGAQGNDYPLVIGSDSFIPGFEPQLVGLKASDEKEFGITFPKDYGVKDLQSRQVTFKVTIHAVKAVKKAKLDDEFAASVGPFKTVTELKADVKKQLSAEAKQRFVQEYDNQLLQSIAEKSNVAIPAVLIDEEIDRMEEDEKQNLVYRGQTWQEHLDAEGVTAEAHREQKRPQAELRVKAGLVLAEIADREQIIVTPEELEVRIQLLKGQYQDAVMQAELDKSENRRDIMNRLISEKTLERLRSLSSAA